MAQKFLNFMQFFGTFCKGVCWRSPSPEGWRPLLQGILDPALHNQLLAFLRVLLPSCFHYDAKECHLVLKTFIAYNCRKMIKIEALWKQNWEISQTTIWVQEQYQTGVVIVRYAYRLAYLPPVSVSVHGGGEVWCHFMSNPMFLLGGMVPERGYGMVPGGGG